MLTRHLMAVVWGSPQEVRWSLESPGGQKRPMSTGRLIRICVLAVILALIVAFQLMAEGTTPFFRRDRPSQPTMSPSSRRSGGVYRA